MRLITMRLMQVSRFIGVLDALVVCSFDMVFVSWGFKLLNTTSGTTLQPANMFARSLAATKPFLP